MLTGGAGGCDVPLEWLVPHDAAQGRYVNPTNACRSFQPHPSTFAKRHRLCRPSGNPLGLNPAGVLLFRMRAHQMENAPWKAGRSVGTSHPSVHRPPPRACCRFARVLPGDAGGCDVPLEWLVPHDAAQGRYVNPTNACQSFQPHPSTFAFSGSADQVATVGAESCWGSAVSDACPPDGKCTLEGGKKCRHLPPKRSSATTPCMLPFRTRAARRRWRLRRAPLEWLVGHTCNSMTALTRMSLSRSGTAKASFPAKVKKGSAARAVALQSGRRPRARVLAGGLRLVTEGL